MTSCWRLSIRLQPTPAAIAIDVNFAPFGSEDFVTPGDPAFFDECLRIYDKRHIPVVLGVNWKDPSESEERHPERLIESERYGNLAGWIVIHDDMRMLPSECGCGKKQMRSMSAKLAEAKQAGSQYKSRWGWLAESISDSKYRPYLVDYSPLKQLRESTDHRLRSIDPYVIRSDPGSIFKNKLVLIGNGTPGLAPDTFTVPMLTEKDPVPGIYVHACGANTLATRPLYELTHLGRTGLDLLLSTVVLASVAGIRYGYRNEGSTETIEKRKEHLELFFTIAVAVVACGIATFFTQQSRILWTDFFIVCTVLVLHPILKPYIIKAFIAIVAAGRHVWNWVTVKV